MRIVLSRALCVCLCVGAALALAACVAVSVVTPSVEIYHSPIVATSGQSVTFTATALDTNVDVDIMVNAASVKKCTGLQTGQTCVYTGGPYPTYEGTVVAYAATGTRLVNNAPAAFTAGYYTFAITDGSYTWSTPAIPARLAGVTADKIDFVFSPSAEYATLGPFVADVQAKIMNVFHAQDIVRTIFHMDAFNFYIYTKYGNGDNCGIVHADAGADMPWRNVDAVLHVAAKRDCTIGSHYSAEGSNTQAFLHEAGHAVWGLADEYDDSPACTTYYFEAAAEPNIFSLDATCRTEQTTKSRTPDACWQFTACQQGWSGIHPLNNNTVMQVGTVGQPWGIEAAERVNYVYSYAPPKAALEGSEAGVVVVDLEYVDGVWHVAEGGVLVLPCQPPVPHMPPVMDAPVIEVVGKDGEVLFTQLMIMDPLVVLWEPDGPGVGPPGTTMAPQGPTFLTETRLQIALPLFPNADRVDFYASRLRRADQGAPDASVPIADALRRFQDLRPAPAEAACRLPELKPDALK